MTIGQRIRERRDELGLSQRDLGRRLGLSSEVGGVAVARWEAGTRTPNLESVRKLASALRVSWVWLVEEPAQAPEPTGTDDG